MAHPGEELATGLQFEVWDHDRLTENEIIGTAAIRSTTTKEMKCSASDRVDHLFSAATHLTAALRLRDAWEQSSAGAEEEKSGKVAEESPRPRGNLSFNEHHEPEWVSPPKRSATKEMVSR